MTCSRIQRKSAIKQQWHHAKANTSLKYEVDPDILLKNITASFSVYNNTDYVENFRREYLLDSLLSKLARPLVSPSQRVDAAIEKLLETEKTCGILNTTGFPNSGFSLQAERFNTVILRAQTIAKAILGEFDFANFEPGAFSAGASTSRRRSNGDPYYKYKTSTYPIEVTSRALPYALALIANTPEWNRYGAKIKVTRGNVIFTVPKKTEIDRCCAKEPDLNMALQRSIGSAISAKLKQIGVNLNDQRPNQRYAKEGSNSGKLATIDLSSASDSLSTRLVRTLIPYDWFHILDDLRCHEGVLPDGSTLTWQKFSSMGNGFTFELESLIFYCLSKAVIDYERSCDVVFNGPGTISVYGDDIICPTAVAPSIISVLDDVGFKTNIEKTFISGPFRESCGRHYLDGRDVTPFYVREPIDSIYRIIWLVNKIRYWSYSEHTETCDSITYELWRFYMKLLPRRIRGSRNIQDAFAIYSPGRTRDKLSPARSKRKLNGIPRYLRSLQVWPTIVEPFGPFTWAGRSTVDYLCLDAERIFSLSPGLENHNEAIVVLEPHRYKFVSNEELWSPRYYLYSEEY